MWSLPLDLRKWHVVHLLWPVGFISVSGSFLAEVIYKLVKDASSFGSAGIFVVLIFGLFTKFGKVKSATASLVCGAFVWIISHYVLDFKWSYMLLLSLSLNMLA